MLGIGVWTMHVGSGIAKRAPSPFRLLRHQAKERQPLTAGIARCRHAFRCEPSSEQPDRDAKRRPACRYAWRGNLGLSAWSIPSCPTAIHPSTSQIRDRGRSPCAGSCDRSPSQFPKLLGWGRSSAIGLTLGLSKRYAAPLDCVLDASPPKAIAAGHPVCSKLEARSSRLIPGGRQPSGSAEPGATPGSPRGTRRWRWGSACGRRSPSAAAASWARRP